MIGQIVEHKPIWSAQIQHTFPFSYYRSRITLSALLVAVAAP